MMQIGLYMSCWKNFALAMICGQGLCVCLRMVKEAKMLACIGEAFVCMAAAIVVVAVTVIVTCLVFKAPIKNFLSGPETKC